MYDGVKHRPREFRKIEPVIIEKEGTYTYALIEYVNESKGEQYHEYKNLVSATYKGKYIIRGGKKLDNCRQILAKFANFELKNLRKPKDVM